MTTPQYDLQFVRNQFPNIGDWAFFENAGGTFVPTTVSDRIYDYMRRNQVQPGAPYSASAEAMDRIDRSHRRLSEMIGAKPREVIIGHSTTMNVYVLANAIRSSLKPGDEVVVTNLDHEANIGAWRRLVDRGIVIKEWRIDSATADLGGPPQLAQLLTEKTRLVCCTWCSNITGTINDIQAIAELTHSVGALLCVDAVAYAPHRALNFENSNADFLLFSLYKLYGPHLGVLCGRHERLLGMENQNHFFFTRSALPQKLQPGGYQHETAAAIEGVVEYLEQVFEHHFGPCEGSASERYHRVFDLFTQHEDEIAHPFMDYLNSKPNVRVIGLPEIDFTRRVPTISFTVENRRPSEIAKKLGEANIGIGSGDFYARRCIDALDLGRDGVIRVSMVHYNSRSEVTRLIDALDEML